MRLLDDECKVRNYINGGNPCPTDLLLAFYVRCKRDGQPVPEPVDNFITGCLDQIYKTYQQGLTPKYNEIFGFKFSKGRHHKSPSARREETLKVGLKLEILMDDGLKYDDAIISVAEEKKLSPDTIRKAYTAYKKMIDTPAPEPAD